MKKNKHKNQPQPASKPNIPQWESVRPHAKGYLITVAAKPSSKLTKVTEINSQFIGVSIAAPPREGQANEELVDYITRILGVKKSGVYVDKGGKSRNKIVVVQDCPHELSHILQILKEQI